MEKDFFVVFLVFTCVLIMWGCSHSEVEYNIGDINRSDMVEPVFQDVDWIINDTSRDSLDSEGVLDIGQDVELSDINIEDVIEDLTNMDVSDDIIGKELEFSDLSLEDDVGVHKCSYEERVHTNGLELDIVVDLRDFKASRYFIDEIVSVEAESDGDTITLFGNNHLITAVDGEYVYEGSKITICVSPYKKGDKITTKMSFVVNSNNELFGLRRWRLNYQESVIGPFTEPYFTHYWLFVPQSSYSIAPQYDFNIILNRVSLSIKVPDNYWKVYSIGGIRNYGNNIYTFEFSTPIPLYSLSFAASNYYNEFSIGKTESDIEVKGIALKSNLSRAKQAFASAIKTINRMEEIVGKYDFGKILQLADIPEFGGGMEHVTIIWIGSSIINAQPIESQYVTAHEVVHHWWGNNVMFYDWPHFWLAEGFTEWSTIYEIMPLITEKQTVDKLKYYWRLFAAEEYSQYGVPLRFSDSEDIMNYFNDVLDQFYKYGSSIVEMILLRLERDFNINRYAFLRKWYEKFKHKRVTTEDLREFLINFTNNYDFWEKFFNEWIYSTPCPTLKVFDFEFVNGNLSFKIMKTAGNQELKNLQIHISTNYEEKIVSVDIGNVGDVKEISTRLSSSPRHITIDPDYYFVFLIDKSQWTGPEIDFGREGLSQGILNINPEFIRHLHQTKYRRFYLK
ncbi:MAG: M1 family aminopeptidase [Deltaproteobacteria bacterium]|nr:M1 family aminopeptidase [Deltaproteobacteria bacterium]